MSTKTSSTDGVLRRTVMKAAAVAIGALAMGGTAIASEHEDEEYENGGHEDDEDRTVYVIAVSEITDFEPYMNEYLPAAAATVAEYGGEALVVSFDPEVIEGDWDHTITIVLEFPCESAVQDWRNDETYQELRAMRNEWVNYTDIIVAPQFAPEDLA